MAELIASMRGLDSGEGATVAEIAAECGRKLESVRRSLHTLRKRGRVRLFRFDLQEYEDPTRWKLCVQ